MLTARKVFSSNLTISAAVGDETAYDFINSRPIEGFGDLGATDCDAADDLGRIADGITRVAGINALGRISDENIFADDKILADDCRQDDFFSRARVSRAFQHDQHTRAPNLGDGLGCLDNVRHIGIARFPQWRRHADADGVNLTQVSVTARLRGVPRIDKTLDTLNGDIINITLAGVDLPNLVGVYIHPGYAKAGFSEFDRQRQPDIAQADHMPIRASRSASLLQQTSACSP